MSTGQQLRLTLMLSVPAVLAQLSSIVMQYIDAAMVGSLGAGPSASIGLVSTSTWLFSGICSAVAIGFSVQVAHAIGAGDMTNARAVLRQAILSVSVFGLLWGAAGVSVSGALPHWLGGDESICHDSSGYFRIYSAFLPVFQIYVLSSGMLRCSGNMRIPSMMSVLMCLLDVVFNFFLIFPTREMTVLGMSVTMPGAGWGVKGAALGTGLAEAVVAVILMRYLFSRSGDLRLKGERGRFIPTAETLRKAVRIGLPMAIEHAVICGAQIMTTVIDFRDSGQLVRRHRREPLLHARLRYRGCRYYPGGPELWGRQEGPYPPVRKDNRSHGHGRDGGDGCGDVFRCALHDGYDD